MRGPPHPPAAGLTSHSCAEFIIKYRYFYFFSPPKPPGPGLPRSPASTCSPPAASRPGPEQGSGAGPPPAPSPRPQPRMAPTPSRSPWRRRPRCVRERERGEGGGGAEPRRSGPARLTSPELRGRQREGAGSAGPPLAAASSPSAPPQPRLPRWWRLHRARPGRHGGAAISWAGGGAVRPPRCGLGAAPPPAALHRLRPGHPKRWGRLGGQRTPHVSPSFPLIPPSQPGL